MGERIQSLPSATALALTDVIPADCQLGGTTGVRGISLANLQKQFGQQCLGAVAGNAVPATATGAGYFYLITAAGTSQTITWSVGDKAVYQGTSGSWARVPAMNAATFTALGALDGSLDGNSNFTITGSAAVNVGGYTFTLGVAGNIVLSTANVAAGTLFILSGVNTSNTHGMNVVNAANGGTVVTAFPQGNGGTINHFGIYQFDGTAWRQVYIQVQTVAAVNALQAGPAEKVMASLLNAATATNLGAVPQAITAALNASFLPARPGNALVMDGAGTTWLQRPSSDANLSFGDSYLTVEIWFYVAAVQTAVLTQAYGSGSDKPIDLVLESDGSLKLTLRNSGSATPLNYTAPAGTYAAGWNYIAYSTNNPTVAIYAQGLPLTVTGSGFTGFESTWAPFTLGDAFNEQNPNYFRGEIAMCRVWNRCLSAVEIVSNALLAPVDFKDRWGSQTAQTSGSLIVGRNYRITAAGGTFTGVGAANNNVNTEFLATGTTPTWSTGGVKPIGCVAEWAPEGLQPNPGLWLDSSTNNLHLPQPTSGTTLLKSQTRFKYVWTIAAPAFLGGSARAILPAKYVITDIIVDTAGTPTISVGYDATNKTQRVASVTLAAGVTPLTLVTAGRSLSSQQVYVDQSANATTINVTIFGYIAD